MEFVFDRVENIVGKGEKPAFSPFPQCFQKHSLSFMLIIGIVW